MNEYYAYEIDANTDDYLPPELINNLNPEKLLILKEKLKEVKNEICKTN